MTAVRIGTASRMIAVAAPGYIAQYGQPETPKDLRNHNCVRLRVRGAISRWEFRKDDGIFNVPVKGLFISNDINLVVRAVLEGIGIGYILEACVAPHIEQGQLVPILDNWALSWSGWHIYFPNRRHMSLPLRMFIDFVKSDPDSYCA
jgi:DNA-binding transcriptional LysR family regulator